MKNGKGWKQIKDFSLVRKTHLLCLHRIGFAFSVKKKLKKNKRALAFPFKLALQLATVLFTQFFFSL